MANETLQTLSFDVVKRITVPFLIIPDDGMPKYLKFNTAIEADKTTFSERVRKAKPAENGGAQQSTAPMRIADVVDLQTGEEFRLVAHEVLENTLNEAYANGGYVGKLFEIKKTKRAGKRYFSFDVTEIKLKQPTTSGVAQGPKK